MNSWINVNAKEFVALIKAYPNKLIHSKDLIVFSGELILNYDDFSDGKVYPESRIFQEVLPKEGKDIFRVEKKYYESLTPAAR